LFPWTTGKLRMNAERQKDGKKTAKERQKDGKSLTLLRSLYNFTLMARVKNNELIEGLSGRVGGLVFKSFKSGTIITSLADRSKVKLSANQKKANSKFKEAVAYAQDVLADPKKSSRYKARLKEGKSIYHTALSEYLSGKV